MLDVVEIFDRVQKRVPATLVMVGDGPDRPAAEALCREKGIAPHVSFLGNMPARRGASCPSADLYLLPTDSESFGLSALEAQACGVPVLGYAVGGLPEVVAHGETGFLRAVGDVGGLADDGAALLLDEARYRAMAAAARRRARLGSSTRTRSSRATSRCTSASSPRPDGPRAAQRAKLLPGRAPRARRAGTRRASVVPKRPGSSVESVTGTPAASSERTRVRRARGDGARREVRRRADVADDAAPRELAEQRGVLGGADAVRDAHGREVAQRLRDGVRPRPLARVHDGHEAEASAPRRNAAAKSRAENAVSSPPRPKPDARAATGAPRGDRGRASRGRGPPVPHDVEEDDDRARGPSPRARRRHASSASLTSNQSSPSFSTTAGET